VRRCGPFRQDGFTLIEVLVAFVILVAALPVLYAIFSGGLRGMALAGDYQGAVAVGESRLAQTGIVDVLGEAEETTTQEGRYTLTLTTQPYQPWRDVSGEQLAVRAYRVTLDIGWEQHGAQRVVSLSTIKLATPAGVAGR